MSLLKKSKETDMDRTTITVRCSWADNSEREFEVRCFHLRDAFLHVLTSKESKKNNAELMKVTIISRIYRNYRGRILHIDKYHPDLVEENF